MNALARHLAHGGKHKGVGDATGLEMPRDHDGPATGIVAVQDFGALQGHDNKLIGRHWVQPLIWIRSRQITAARLLQLECDGNAGLDRGG